MAKKQDTKVTERVYTVPLRKEFQKVPRWKRTKKAVSALRTFLAQHMKSEHVKLSKALNEEVWKHGIKNPPHHVKVSVSKDEQGIVTADLFSTEEQKKIFPKKKEATA